MNTHEGVFICGYCKKETPIEDDAIIRIVKDDSFCPSIDYFTCDCGHLSYASSIRFKAQINKKDWQGWHRGSAE